MDKGLMLEVKPELTLTMPHPKLDIRKMKGLQVEKLPDGFILMKFDENVKWYVHKDDLTIPI